MQENNQLITINIYLRAFYLYAIEATRKHQLSHLLNEPFFIYLVVVIVIICISWRKSKLIKISSFLLPYFEITLTFFFSTLSMVFISKHSIDLIMNWEGFLLFQGKKNSVEDDNMWQLEWFFPFHDKFKKIPENNRIFHSPLLSYKKIFPVKKKEIILNDYRRIKNLFFH